MNSDENVSEESTTTTPSTLKSLLKANVMRPGVLNSKKAPITTSLSLSKPPLNTQLTLGKSNVVRPSVVSSLSITRKVGSHLSSSINSIFDEEDDDTHIVSTKPPLGDLETLIQSGIDSLPSTANSIPTSAPDDEDLSLTDIPTYSRRLPVENRLFDTRSLKSTSKQPSSSTVDDDDVLSKFMKTVESKYEEEQVQFEARMHDSTDAGVPTTEPIVSEPSPPTHEAPVVDALHTVPSDHVEDMVDQDDEEASIWAMFPMGFGKSEKSTGILTSKTIPSTTIEPAPAAMEKNSNSTILSHGPTQNVPETSVEPGTNSTVLASGVERFFGDEEELEEGDYAESDMLTWAQRQATVKKKDFSVLTLPPLSTLLPFEKNIYIEHPAVAALTNEQVQEMRKQDNVKVRGLDIPKPISSWSHCGLPSKLDQILINDGCTTPFPIQCHTLPIILSGRDCIACAKTGSGKTLAFVLPMLRHISRQEPLREGEGPIAIILIPTRELAVQCAAVVKKLGRGTGARVVAAYGGHNVADQIALCKQGCEVIVGTPGRILDLLSLNKGKIINLHRVTYVVLDEADRMFDMGFEPQILMIVKNTRPDRQTVLFSATFPKTIENLAKQVLTRPIEVVIGGKSVASDTVTQIVEVIDEQKKFYRLLEILGNWYGKGNILIFVDRQDTAEMLYAKLAECGYPALALHGGMDQVDRDYTVADFKNKLRTILVATSLVSRGLDVKELNLVVNYVVPSHMEDYIHRIGRTGRAGNLGTAVTFITPEEESKSIDLVRALERSKVAVPQALQTMCDAFREKVAKKEAIYYSNSGYVTTGYRFTESEAKQGKQRQDAERSLLAEREGLELGGGADEAAETEQERLDRLRQQEERRERERREREEQERTGTSRKREKKPKKEQSAATAAPAESAESAAATATTADTVPTADAVPATKDASPQPSAQPSTSAPVAAAGAAPAAAPAVPTTTTSPTPAVPVSPTTATTTATTAAATTTTAAAPAPAAAPAAKPTSSLLASVQAARAAAQQVRAAVTAVTTASTAPAPVAPPAPGASRMTAPPPPPPSTAAKTSAPGTPAAVSTPTQPSAAAPAAAGAPASAQRLGFDIAAVKEAARLAAQASMQSNSSSVPATAAQTAQAKTLSLEVQQKALAAAARLAQKVSSISGITSGGAEGVDYFRINFVVNDYPQQARWTVLKKETLSEIMDQCDVSLLVKGVFIPPGKQPQLGEDKLYVSIEGRSEDAVSRARVELYRRLEEASRNVQIGTQGGKYNVL